MKPQTVPTIPEHLRANLPDPLSHLTKKAPAKSTSMAKTGDSNRLKAELAKLKAEREQKALHLKAMKAKAKASSRVHVPPPPQSLASLGAASTKRKKR
jgi:hypothetical protein